MSPPILIRGGFVLSMSDRHGGDGKLDVLIEGDRILEIGPSLASGRAKVIDAEGCIVMPGLIDAHRHLWYTPLRAEAMDHSLGELAKDLWPRIGGNITAEDLYSATRTGIVEALDAGITTVFDYCHAINTPAHADRAIDAHLGLPGRAVFAFGPSIAQKVTELSGGTPTTDWSHARTIQQRVDLAPRLTMALALQGPDTSGRAGFERDVSVAREMGVPITAHIASADGGPKNTEIEHMEAWGLLGPDMTLIHCTGASDEDFATLLRRGVQVCATPMCEWLIGMGLPPMGRMLLAGLRPAVGADAMVATTGDLFDEARTGLMAARQDSTAKVIGGGTAVSRCAELGMSSMEALQAITSRAAAAVFMADRIGTLETGKKADVIVIGTRGCPPETANEAAALLIGSASARDVRTVLVDGAVVKEAGQLVGIDIAAITAEVSQTRKRMKTYRI